MSKNRNKLSSTSNLPTANNSFHTVLSSPEQDNLGDDQYAQVNTSYSKQKKKGRKPSSRKASADDESFDYADKNSNCSATGSGKRKSDDFKVKFKTEMCKFWELEGLCKFSDNVKKN